MSADVETAVFYHRLPSRVTAEEFHLIGAQSVVETDRIDDLTAPEVSLRLNFYSGFIRPK